jgi:hypothetical protein
MPPNHIHDYILHHVYCVDDVLEFRCDAWLGLSQKRNPKIAALLSQYILNALLPQRPACLTCWPTANGPLQDLRRLRSVEDLAPGLVRLPVSEDRVARPVSLMRRCGRVPECMSAEEFGIIAKSYAPDPPDDNDSLVLHPFHLPFPHFRPRHHERTPSHRHCGLHENVAKTPPR